MAIRSKCKNGALRPDAGRYLPKVVSCVAGVVLTIHVYYVRAQEPGANKGCETPGPSLSGQEWYHPAPAGSHHLDGTIALAPLTVERPAVPIPAAVRGLATAKLANAEVVRLTREDCRALGVPFEADQLLNKAIEEDATFVKQGLKYMSAHPLDGSSSDATYKSIERGIAEHKARIAHWKNLRGRVAPYLIRAVAANDFGGGFDAIFSQGSVTVTHSFTIRNTANDPLHQYASIGDVAPPDMVKSPVVVYVEQQPTHVYTTIHVLKLGR